MTGDYNIDYEDERFQDVEAERDAALAESDAMYDGMITSSDEYYNDLISETKNYEETQKANQQAQTDFAIEQIEQQKKQAAKDYTKEQSGAYADWQKESNKYGANAEAMAAQGLAHTGYSESSQVAMYNQYQNRVATARESYSRAILNYDNAITEARLQNSSALAQIAHDSLQTQLTLALEGLQYKNDLLLDKAAANREINNTYYGRYQDVLTQINTENAFKEQARQFDAELAYKEALAEIEGAKEEELILLGDNETAPTIPTLPYVEDSIVGNGLAPMNGPGISIVKADEITGARETATDDKMEVGSGTNTEKTSNGSYVGGDGDWTAKLVGPDGVSAGSGGVTTPETQPTKETTSGGNTVLPYASATNASGLTKAGTPSGIQILQGNGAAASGRTLGEYAVVTPYYTGDYNPDVKEFGVMSNGYQPKGIKGYGEVKKTGDKFKFTTQTRAGEKVVVEQNIWKTADGTLWYWDGRGNAYAKLPKFAG